MHRSPDSNVPGRGYRRVSRLPSPKQLRQGFKALGNMIERDVKSWTRLSFCFPRSPWPPGRGLAAPVRCVTVRAAHEPSIAPVQYPGPVTCVMCAPHLETVHTTRGGEGRVNLEKRRVSVTQRASAPSARRGKCSNLAVGQDVFGSCI